MDDQHGGTVSPVPETNITDPSNQAPAVPESGTAAPETPVSPVVAPPTPRSRRKLFIVVVIIIVLVVAGGAWLLFGKSSKPAAKAATLAPVRIGLSLDSLQTARWGVEEGIMQKKAASLGATLTPYIANSDDATQISQIENLIAQKVNVIIIVAHDAAAVAPATEDAQKAGIKVIAYDRLMEGDGTTEYITFNNYKVGVLMAQNIVSLLPTTLKTANVAFLEGPLTDNNVPQVDNGVLSVLTPLINSGKIKLVFDQHITNWDPGVAYTTFKADLATGTRVDAVIGGNDDLAYGAIQALQEVGQAGKIPVTGQDAELAAVQRLIAGTQTLTVYKPGAELANRAVEDAIALTRGQKVQTNATEHNLTVGVPSYLFDPIGVTKDNITSTVIKGGTYTTQQVYGTSTK